MATTPRIPADVVQWVRSGAQVDGAGGDDARASDQSELRRLVGIPLMVSDGLNFDPVVAELVRIMSGRKQGCMYRGTSRNAVALQRGVDEDMISKLSHFETSDLPEKSKAALRIVAAMADYPKDVTDDLWEQAREFFTDRELADIVWYVAFCTGTKVKVTLGLDPGEGKLLYPTNDAYKAQYTDDEIEELREAGYKVSADA